MAEIRSLQPELGQVIRILRGEKEFSSREQLSEASGVAVSTIERVENGHSINPERLTAILEALATNFETVRQRALGWRQQPSKPLSSKGESSELLLYGIFDAVDKRVSRLHGSLISATTKDETEFSARRLFMSLCVIDLPVEMAIQIVKDLPDYLEAIDMDGSFMTSHIRLAVSRIIGQFSVAEVRRLAVIHQGQMTADALTKIDWEQKKTEWAKRYSRRYGNAGQSFYVVEQDGTHIALNYQFLRNDLIPRMLKRLLGNQGERGSRIIINTNAVNELAGQLMQEFKRLDAYCIRYKTALYLAEEIAMQPPHPWLVTPATRDSTVDYDLQQATAHLESLNTDIDNNYNERWHHLAEVIHHSCSAILGIYGGFIGSKYLSSLKMLKQWVDIHQNNVLLWEYCDLRLMMGDIGSAKILLPEGKAGILDSPGNFSAFLKSIDRKIRSDGGQSIGDLFADTNCIFEIANALVLHRRKMEAILHTLESGNEISASDSRDLLAEAILAIFGAHVQHYPRGSIDQRGSGFVANIETRPSNNSGRSCLFFILEARKNDATLISDVVEVANVLGESRFLQDVYFVYDKPPPPKLLSELKKEAVNTLKENGVHGSAFFLPLANIRHIVRAEYPRLAFQKLELDYSL